MAWLTAKYEEANARALNHDWRVKLRHIGRSGRRCRRKLSPGLWRRDGRTRAPGDAYKMISTACRGLTHPSAVSQVVLPQVWIWEIRNPRDRIQMKSRTRRPMLLGEGRLRSKNYCRLSQRLLLPRRKHHHLLRYPGRSFGRQGCTKTSEKDAGDSNSEPYND